MRAGRYLVAAAALLGAAVIIDGCSNVLGIDGEYGDRPLTDSSTQPPGDAAGGTRDTGSGGTSGTGGTGGSSGSGGGDARDVVIPDVVSDVRVPCDTPPGACMDSIPTGWELVIFADNRDTGCPVNFTGTDVIAGPTAASGACDCSCTVNANPTCNTGRMETRYSTTPGCANVGAALNTPNAGCNSTFQGNISDYFSATPLPATIACTASAVTDDTRVTSTPMRQCTVPTGCREEICTGDVPDGFSACITRTGDVACPSGWSTKTLVGSGANLSCTSCSCTASANCTGGRITFFTDRACTTQRVAFDVNEVCQATGGAGRIESHTYTATIENPQCTATGAKTPTVALSGTRSVCCK